MINFDLHLRFDLRAKVNSIVWEQILPGGFINIYKKIQQSYQYTSSQPKIQRNIFSKRSSINKNKKMSIANEGKRVTFFKQYKSIAKLTDFSLDNCHEIDTIFIKDWRKPKTIDTGQ